MALMTMDRRDFLKAGVLAGGAVGLAGISSPAFAFVPDRPKLTHGVQTGAVADGRALVWARGDRTSKLVVEYSHRPDFKNFRTVKGRQVTPASDFTGRVELTGLAPGAEIHYRVRLEDG